MQLNAESYAYSLAGLAPLCGGEPFLEAFTLG